MNQFVQDLDAAAVLEVIGSTLVAAGALDVGGLERAQRAAVQSGERLDQVLIKLGLVPEYQMVSALARELKLEQVALPEIPDAAVLADAIAPLFVRTRKVLPIAITPTHLTIACVDPLDSEPARAIAYATGKVVEQRIIAPADFDRAVQALYNDQRSADADDHRLEEANETDVQRLRDIANEAPVIRVVNQIISDAVEARASDIHVEPAVDSLIIRYRVDGELRQAQSYPAGLRAALTSRIKIMAKLDIAERRLPQDGRVKMPVRGVDVDFRVSTIPTAFGESVVMRILDRSRVELDFHSLGFSTADIATMGRLTEQPNGIVLVTGPTGSGKTTTLYTILKQLNQPHLKIFTVEDPIEYQLAGINQVQVNTATGLDFPRALRSMLRQDPDIIMIGEIRDVETARIAIQASLTGHLVLSTLHTNSAAATITRLLDMGAESYLLASTMNGVLAQRLTKRLCRHCAVPHANAAEWTQKIAGELKDVAADLLNTAPRILSPAGCEACHHTGFSGRLALVEMMEVGDHQRSLILSGASDAKLAQTARRAGMHTLYEDGLRKVWLGNTTIEEVLRITRAEE
jgi:general secretion pathway protein E